MTRKLLADIPKECQCLPLRHTIHLPVVSQSPLRLGSQNFFQFTISASNEYAIGLMYDIHLNQGCIDGLGMMSRL